MEHPIYLYNKRIGTWDDKFPRIFRIVKDGRKGQIFNQCKTLLNHTAIQKWVVEKYLIPNKIEFIEFFIIGKMASCPYYVIIKVEDVVSDMVVRKMGYLQGNDKVCGEQYIIPLFHKKCRRFDDYQDLKNFYKDCMVLPKYSLKYNLC